MDYKNQRTFKAHEEYDAFGQFNFGAVGAALSLPEELIKKAAGIASFSSFVRKATTVKLWTALDRFAVR